MTGEETALPDLAAGGQRFAIAVTEPGGGGHGLGARRTSAERISGGWCITGQRTCSTCANVPDYLPLARTEQNLRRKTDGLTLFLLSQPSTGLTTQPVRQLGMRCIPSCDVFLDGVVAVLCSGNFDEVLDLPVQCVWARQAFGWAISECRAGEHVLADGAKWRSQAELVDSRAPWLQSQGLPCATDATMAKLTVLAYAVQPADLGIPMLDGMGSTAETDLRQYWRDDRINRLAPIGIEMVRNVVAESVGLGRSC